jgi:geranyl-CoA carboxylase alpha subunit
MSARFSSLLVANRGEIACRVLRAARAEGLRAIAVYSDADAGAPHVRLADAAVRLGPAPAAQSYLSIPALIDAAKASGAQAIHPGYGFLAENADFAEAARAAGLVFVGPSPQAIRAMGDKSAAKARMAAAGVPCAPGYHGEDQSDARLADEARRIGFPAMVKASAGGGGRGLRILRAAAELDAAIGAARAEALAAFGDGRLLIERALLDARHVEIQVFGDEHGALVQLSERDCSVQRRHQKLIEEAPAVSPELREAMGAAAVRAARAVDYVGAGTVEFLLDREGAFYFLEMNTRIQVEHPVTEAVTGLDLVALQLRVAQGEPLPFSQADVRFSGHAIEARLYAEDSAFRPSLGRLAAFRPGPGVRVDAGVEAGSEVTPYYDSLLAKLIAHGATREEARRKLIAALEQTFVAGVATNRAFLLHALAAPAFAEGPPSTAFVEQTPFTPAPPGDLGFALAAVLLVDRGEAPALSPSWRTAPARLVCEGVERRLELRRDGADWLAGDLRVRLVERGVEEARFESGGVVRRAAFAREGAGLWLDLDGACRRYDDLTYAPPAPAQADAEGAARSPVSGVVVALHAAPGERVRRGQILATVEAMKMQYDILSPRDGVVGEVAAAAGRTVAAQAVLVAFLAEEG